MNLQVAPSGAIDLASLLRAVLPPKEASDVDPEALCILSIELSIFWSVTGQAADLDNVFSDTSIICEGFPKRLNPLL